MSAYTDKADTGGRLLAVLAEELKLPLMQIARQAELVRSDPDAQLLEHIETAAAQAMWFIDSYLLSHQLQYGQQTLQLEPVVVSGVLHDAAQGLARLARQYNCTLEVQLAGRYGPVMAHRAGLLAALMGLGTTLITAADRTPKSRIVFAAHKSRGGTVAGVFSENDGLSQAAYRQGRVLYGHSRHPLHTITAQAGAGVFIADSLMQAMAVHLRVARHHKLTGLAATLVPSRQLSLV